MDKRTERNGNAPRPHAPPQAPPGFSPPVRGLPDGDHPFLDLLPACVESPALRLVGCARFPGGTVVASARVRIVPEAGYCWIDETVPVIVLTRAHYDGGSDLDLHLDLLHEATHLRHLLEGRDVWDANFPYHRRPTEIEGYAVAVFEGRRLGLDEAGIRAHLANPWMTPEEVGELHAAVESRLRGLTPA